MVQVADVREGDVLLADADAQSGVLHGQTRLVTPGHQCQHVRGEEDEEAEVEVRVVQSKPHTHAH